MGSGSFLSPPETKAPGQSWLSGLGCPLSPGKYPQPRPATPNLPVSCHLHWELRKPGWRKAREARYALHLDSEDVGLCSLQGGAWRRASESTAVPPPRPPPANSSRPPGPSLPVPHLSSSGPGVSLWGAELEGGGRGACCRQGRARPLTCFHGAVDVRLGLVVDPVEAGLHGQARQHAVLAAVAVRGGDVHCAALVVQRLFRVVAVLVPALGHPQLHARPLVHHGDG